MSFKTFGKNLPCPEDPESLFHDLRKRKVLGLLSHQADILRNYKDIHQNHVDIALQLPTGSGKTLVGLLIAEWWRKKYHQRVVYLCPTRQLVNQVFLQATQQYGLDVIPFTGSQREYGATAIGDYQSAETVAITTYSSLFNTNPFFVDPHLIILDDAHSAENYISKYWSLEISKRENSTAFSAFLGLILPFLSHSDKQRFNRTKASSNHWVDKISTPKFYELIPNIIELLDVHVTCDEKLKYSWSIIRNSLHACHLYISCDNILIRPLIPPSNVHSPFSNARQRVYMSATLGEGGDLERVTGRTPIHKMPVPLGWDRQGIGRRFFIFPKRSLEETEVSQFIVDAMKHAGRSLYLATNEQVAKLKREQIENDLHYKTFDARLIEDSKDPFINSPNAVAVIANRYDGIDLKDDECRLLFFDDLPEAANLQEKFLMHRMSAQLLLDDRVLTRLVQGFGRCTRSPNDYACVVILGSSLHGYLLKKERREFFHPEIQAEIEFGLEQSKVVTGSEILENFMHFLGQDQEWQFADQSILELRGSLEQKKLKSTSELASTVSDELAYQYSIWNRDFLKAIEHCHSILGKLRHKDLRGYRALWLYLAGSASWIAFKEGLINDDRQAKNYFLQAYNAAPILNWLIELARRTQTIVPDKSEFDGSSVFIIERIEKYFEKVGTQHDGRYAQDEAFVLKMIMQNEDGTAFEQGQLQLGKMLGYDAGKSAAEAAPDPWWIGGDHYCFVFEDHAEGKPDTIFSPTKARQARSHADWIKMYLNLAPTIEITNVLITHCTKASEGALPSLSHVMYWNIQEFRNWAKRALHTLREIKLTYQEQGNIEWRLKALQELRDAKITPCELRKLLSVSAAEVMGKGDEH